MKKLSFAAGAALLASTAMVQAGGIDRSGQSVGIIFEEDSYAEFSVAYVDPSISGVAFTFPTGDMGTAYTMFSGGYKTDIGDKFSVAVIFDQPFGAAADYPAGSPYAGISATLNSTAVTGVLSYDVSDRFVVYAGASAQTLSAVAALPTSSYTVDASADTGFGYVAGAAFQIPDIALRVALTYRSEVSTSHPTVEVAGPNTIPGVTNLVTPQSINLEFQTGINPKTLVFGSIRWVEWSTFDISPPVGGTLVSYNNDVVTYSLGVGRKLSDTLSGAVTLGYEAAQGGAASTLSPTDGYFSVGGGLTYKLGAAEITGGVKYIWIGDATDTNGSVFAGNNGLAVGFKISYAM